MARKRKELPEISNVEITGIAAEGKAIAKIKLKETDESPIVVFIPYGAPGDIVDIKIDRKKHNYAEAHITRIVKPSPLRIKPRCDYFGVCGGCKWQHLPYEEQLKFKRQQVVDALTRIGKIDIPEVPMTLGSEKIWEYRNKMEYTFSDKRWKSWEEMRGEQPSGESEKALGFHIPGSFDKVLQIDKCWLQDEKGNEERNFIYNKALLLDKDNNDNIKKYIKGGNVFYNIKENHGFLRNLIIRNSTTGERMLVMFFGDKGTVPEDENGSDLYLNFLNSIASAEPTDNCQFVINEKLNDSISDLDVQVWSGKSFIEEKMGDLTFRISPKSFYQTNSLQAQRLYQTAAEFADLPGKENAREKPLIYDLYTGAGTIANFVSRFASKVIGIEYVEDAIKDAKINSEINGITNTEFFAGDMKDVLTKEFIEAHGKPQIMIVDPPRAGMHEDVVKVILEAEPETIVYVSCNPATQARDIALMDSKYKVTRIQPVDMFPHTHHVENVVKLEKRL